MDDFAQSDFLSEFDGPDNDVCLICFDESCRIFVSEFGDDTTVSRNCQKFGHQTNIANTDACTQFLASIEYRCCAEVFPQHNFGIVVAQQSVYRACSRGLLHTRGRHLRLNYPVCFTNANKMHHVYECGIVRSVGSDNKDVDVSEIENFDMYDLDDYLQTDCRCRVVEHRYRFLRQFGDVRHLSEPWLIATDDVILAGVANHTVETNKHNETMAGQIVNAYMHDGTEIHKVNAVDRDCDIGELDNISATDNVNQIVEVLQRSV